MSADHKLIAEICIDDCNVLMEKEKSYGSSWKQRGGVGAFMMLARKWDRVENQCKKEGYDIFTASAKSARVDGLLDDIADLRRYLLLVEQEVRNQAASPGAGYIDQ